MDAPCVTPVRESLLQWANATAPEDSKHKPGTPAITRAMAYIWRTHPGVKQTYRDLFGRHRNDFIRWFTWYGQWESDLTTVYSVPMDQEFRRWAHAPSQHDPRRGSVKPVITNLMAYIYQTRSDLQEQFPDLYGKDRVDFTAWLLVFGCDRYPLGSVMTEPLLASWDQQ